MAKNTQDLFLPTEGPGRNDLKKLYEWSFEDAWEAQEEWEASHGQGRGPFFRWMGAQELKQIYDMYKTGYKHAVTEGLYTCALNSLPMPRWLEMAYLGAYRTVRHYKAKSWDDVFGRPHPKGTHLGTKKQERDFAWKVYRRIQQIKQDNPSIPIDGFLFERIGKELGIGGKTLTEEYYYIEKNKHKRL